MHSDRVEFCESGGSYLGCHQAALMLFPPECTLPGVVLNSTIYQGSLPVKIMLYAVSDQNKRVLMYR